jgi:hypothetical protein
MNLTALFSHHQVPLYRNRGDDLPADAFDVIIHANRQLVAALQAAALQNVASL